MQAILKKHDKLVVPLGNLLLGLALYALVSGYNFSPAPTVPGVDLTGARQMIDSGALVIDVRGQKQYDLRHIPGALLVTLETLRAGIPQSLEFARDMNIIVYCGEGTMRGPEATQILRQAGFTNAVNLEPGIEGWAGAGLRVEKA